jgi:hypothetical protein
MLGDEGKNPTLMTIEGLAAMMTKVLGRLDALDALDDIKARLMAVESQRAPTSTASFPYRMPGFGSSTMAGSSSSAAAVMSAAPTMVPSLPITSILLPHSPSPIPDGFNVPSFDFPSYDGAEDLLNWLHRCEQFFRGQRTLASDRV